jgi:hypothetical protein
MCPMFNESRHILAIFYIKIWQIFYTYTKTLYISWFSVKLYFTVCLHKKIKMWIQEEQKIHLWSSDFISCLDHKWQYTSMGIYIFEFSFIYTNISLTKIKWGGASCHPLIHKKYLGKVPLFNCCDVHCTSKQDTMARFAVVELWWAMIVY